MMSYLVLGLILLSIIHLIYESVIAPSLRLKLRFDLFALRDEVRSLKVEHGDMLRDRHFKYLEDSINSTILMLPRFELSVIRKINEELKKDKELDARVQERMRVLDDCNISRIAEIRKKSLDLANKSFVINSGMLFMYLLPFALLRVIENRIRSAVSMSNADLKKIAPNLDSAEILVPL